MQNETKTPLVSIIVPAFNSENYLARCLNSLVNQTFDSIEILIIDNHSTDATLNIANNYAYMHPEKVFVYSTPQHGSQAIGRNLGIKIARGKYIAWCDSDDYMELQAVKLMYNKAAEGDYDIVICDFYRHENNKRELRCPGNEVIANTTVANIIKDGKYAFWTKFIKTEIYKLAGEMPIDITHVDITYVPILIQNCRKAAYLASPIYNWIIREGSVTRNAAAMGKTHIKTYQYLLEHIKPEFLNIIVINITRMIRTYYNKFYIYGDVQIEYYLKFREKYILKNHAILQDPEVIKMEELISTCSKESMDNNIYINGFNSKDVSERIKFYEEKAFNEGCKVVVLDEKTCNIKENPLIENEYRLGNYQFIAEYFAIQNIYENGGVYISDCIQLYTSLNYIRYNMSFFSYLDEGNLSPYIFGGIAKNEVFKNLLESYTNTVYNNKKTSERIKSILNDLYNITIENAKIIRKKEVWVYPPEMFVLCNYKMFYKNIAEHNFSNMADNEEYIVVKRSTIAAIGISKMKGLNNMAGKYTSLNQSYKALNQSYESLNQKFESLNQKYRNTISKYERLSHNYDTLSLKMENIKGSISFRIARLILFPLRIIKKVVGGIKEK